MGEGWEVGACIFNPPRLSYRHEIHATDTAPHPGPTRLGAARLSFHAALAHKAGAFCFQSLAQLVERLPWEQEAVGAEPTGLTKMAASEIPAATTGVSSIW
jgi:hypothetical protein